MKRESPNLFAALLIGLLSNVLLRSQTAYLPRAGFFAALLCAPILAAVCLLFSYGFSVAGIGQAVSRPFAALLIFSCVLEILRLAALIQRIYPGSIRLSAVCLLLLLPVLYLRRVSALSQSAYAVLCLLAGAGVLLLLSAAPFLRLPNLSARPLTPAQLGTAAADQLTLFPEYLLPALWPAPQKQERRTAGRVAAFALGADVGAHFLLALFYGDAMFRQADPLHATARSGGVSVFHRLDWLQLTLWVMAVTLKIALYLYAVTRLSGGESCKNATPLRHFPLFIGGVWFLCVLLRKLDLDAAFRLRNTLCQLLAGTVIAGGGLVSLCKKGSSH